MTSQASIPLAFAALVSVLATTGKASACCIVGPVGQNASITSENSLIVWDDTRKIEHFIRKVDFSAGGSSLGFLVPTPAKPDIEEADDAVFDRLQALVTPPMAAQNATLGFGGTKGSRAIVTVLEQKRVAGMDVAVLEANDAGALNDWLKRNDYPSRPAIQAWLDPYVRAGFKIAAFKYVKAGAGASEIKTKAVRISCKVDRPFYPYRMPTDTRVNPRQVLRVYLLSARKMRGHLIEGKDRRDWGQVSYEQPAEDVARLLEGALPADKVPSAPLGLTVFDDRNVRRTDPAELYFE